MDLTQILFSLLVLKVFIVRGTFESLCENQGNFNGTKCFLFYLNSRKNWNDARTFCQSHGGDLAVIKSFEEQQFIHEQAEKISHKNDSFWLGYNDLNVEGTFEAVDGQRVSFTAWMKEEPNDAINGEDCVSLKMYDTVPSASWNDLSCKARLGFICEKKASIIGNKPMVANGNNQLVLECLHQQKYNRSRITWFSGPTVLESDQTQLRLMPTRDDDGDEITCSVSDASPSASLGAINDSVILDLTYSPKIQPMTDITVDDGQADVVLPCIVSSKPVSIITWYHNGFILVQGEGTTSGDGYNSLNYTLYNVTRADQGIYECRAFNQIDYDQDRLNLAVKYRRSDEADFHEESISPSGEQLAAIALGMFFFGVGIGIGLALLVQRSRGTRTRQAPSEAENSRSQTHRSSLQLQIPATEMASTSFINNAPVENLQSQRDNVYEGLQCGRNEDTYVGLQKGCAEDTYYNIDELRG